MTNLPPPEIQALIKDHIQAFNTADDALFQTVFSETAIIVDGIAPFRWINPDGPAKWLADCVKWREQFGVTQEEFAYELGFWTVEGSSAYAVISGALTVVMKTATAVRDGLLTYTFTKYGDTWKIDSQSWGRTSDRPSNVEHITGSSPHRPK
ncbi:MAG: hypothetical protein WCB99_08110 [Candidatus Cybelea sp.]